MNTPTPDLSTFNPFDPDFLQRRWPHYKAWRDTAPIMPLVFRPNSYLLSRYDDIAAVIKDPTTRTSTEGQPDAPWLGSGPAAEMFRVQMVLSDPPDHTRLRRFANKAFTPRASAQLAESIESTVERIIADIGTKKQIEAVAEIASVVSAQTTMGILGIERTDWEQLLERVPDFIQIFSPFPLDAVTLDRTNDAGAYYINYFRKFIQQRRDNPHVGIIDDLIAAESEGDQLTEIELIGIIHSILNAGYETTMSTISAGIQLLGSRPDITLAIKENPAVTGAVVEELLRIEPSVHFVRRILPEARTLPSGTLPAQSEVLLCIASANHDERKFALPETFNHERTSNDHLTFGGGRHFCLGVHLARLQVNTTLQKIAIAFPHIRSLEDNPPRQQQLLFPAFDRVPVTLRP
jgi:cytochrome P450